MEISKEMLRKLILDAYREGYAQYEVVNAGLEGYDPEDYTNLAMIKWAYLDNVTKLTALEKNKKLAKKLIRFRDIEKQAELKRLEDRYKENLKYLSVLP